MQNLTTGVYTKYSKDSRIKLSHPFRSKLDYTIECVAHQLFKYLYL